MTDNADELAVLKEILDLAPDMFVVSEWSGAVRYVNPAGRALVGLDDSWDTTDVTTGDFFTAAGLAFTTEVERSLAERGFWKGRSELRHFVTGEPIAVGVSSFVVDRSAGRRAFLASMVRDRRANARQELQLRDAVDASAQYAAEQEAIAQLSRLAIAAELPQLLTTAVSAAATLVGVEKAMITRLSDTDESVLALEAFTGPTGPDIGLPAGLKSLMGYTLITEDVVVCRDRLTERRFNPSVMAAYGLRSGVGIPISGASRPWGVLSVHSVDVRDYDSRAISFLNTVADVLSAAIRRVELNQQLHERTLRDPLTGLLNRAGAYESIDVALARTEREHTVLAVLLLDIDDLKIINDSLGHDAGDLALARFADRLTSAVRDGDYVARLGGDEFLVVGEVDDIEHARRFAGQVTDVIASPCGADEGPTPLSASIGIAVSEPGSTRRELIHRADLAMYRAKDSGPGRHAVFDLDDVYDAERIRTLSIDLRSALDRNELTLAYQPIIDVATGHIVSMEALARWTHHEQGPIGPQEFVAVAERTGLINDLGTWALTAACTQVAAWRTTSDLTIRVNVSALQLHDADFPDHVAGILAMTGCPARALGLEITETVWVADTARVADTLTALHRMGVKLLLDDFGKGHSSISYLYRYPMFECFKIDRSYIAELPGTRPHAIVSAIVAMAKAFDVSVVAEGVETIEQFNALETIGCTLAQGYLLGRPVPAEQATEVLRRSTRSRSDNEDSEFSRAGSGE